MKTLSKPSSAFTLLELIIAVIVVGILASFALPQYQQIVERTRYSDAVNILGALRRAQLRYYSEYGVYATNIGQLDIEISAPNGFTNLVAVPSAAFPSPGIENVVCAITRSSGYIIVMNVDGQSKCINVSSLIKCPPGVEKYTP